MTRETNPQGEFAELAQQVAENKKLHPEKYDRRRKYQAQDGDFTLTPPKNGKGKNSK